MYHASRVIYWLQNGSLLPYPTHNDRQVVFTFGGELFFLWPLLFTRSEFVGRMVFWLGYPLATLGFYTVLRALAIDRSVSATASLVFASTPLILRYSTGLKPELWLTFFFLGTIFWLIQAYQRPEARGRALFFVGIFIALTINVKLTALPLLLPILLLPWLGRPQESKLRQTGLLFVGLGVGFLLSGLGVTMMMNLINYDHILGPEAMRQVHAADLSLRQIYTHAVRLPLLLFELPYLPFAAARQSLTESGNTLLQLLGAARPLPLENAQTWPGLFRYTMPEYAHKFSLGGLLWLPILVIGLPGIVKDIRRSYPEIFPGLLSILTLIDLFFLGAIVFLIRWMVHSGLPDRFLIAPYALGLVIGVVIVSRWLQAHHFLRIAAIGLVIYTVWPPLWLKLKETQTAIIAPASEFQFAMPFAEALSYIPPHSHILLAASQDAPDYPLFLPQQGYRNRVISWGKFDFDPARLQTLIAAHQISHVLIQNDQSLTFHWHPPVKSEAMVDWLANQPDFNEVSLLTGRMRLFETTGAYELRRRQLRRVLDTPPASLSPPLIFIDKTLQHEVGVDSASLKSWRPLTRGGADEQSRLWLGQGNRRGLSGALWSNEERTVRLLFQATPGSTGQDAARRIQITGLVQGKVTAIDQTFKGPTVVEFLVPLRAGRNDFLLTAFDESPASPLEFEVWPAPIVGLSPIVVEPGP